MMNQPDPTPPPDAVPQTQPGVPEDAPVSYLKLTPEREQWLVTLAMDLIAETEKVMGRGANGETQIDSFLWKRKRNMETHKDDLDWRGYKYGGVFAEGHNWTRGKSKELQRMMSAKLTDDLLGTTPFFGAIPNRAGDPTLVKNVEAFVQGKVEDAGIPTLLREAVSAALTRDEVIIHLWRDVQVSKFVGPATVAVDPSTEQPIRTPVKQLYVYPNDDMVPNPSVQGEMILKKDPSFITATQLKYVDFSSLPQEEIIWDGLRGAMLDNRDFICPTNYNSIHETKFCAWRYDREWTQMREQYRGFDTAESYFSTHPESAAMSGDGSDKNQNQPRSSLITYVHAAEVYIREDADQDGAAEEIMMVLDMENQKPVFYDYMRNHMKKRPFEVIVGLRKEANTWAGVGVYTETLHANTFIDMTLNRVNKKDSQTGSATFFNPKATKEWSAELPVKIGGPEIYTLTQGFNETDNKPCFRIPMVEVSEMSMELSDKGAQDLATTFGVSSAASASANNLDRSRTATGNAILEKEGNLVVNEAMKAQAVGIIAVLEQCTDIVLEHMDPTELFLTKEAELITLNRDEIRGIEKDVRLLLTKSRSAEGLATSQQAMNMVMSYLDLPPTKQRAIRDFVVEQLKMLQVTDPDQKVPEPSDEEIAAYQVQAQQVQQPPASASVSAKLTDFTPEEAQQIKARDYSIKPSSPEEVAANDAQKAAQEVAVKKAAQPPPDSKTIPMNPNKAAA